MKRSRSASRKEAALLMDAYNRALADALDAVLSGIQNEDEMALPDFEERLRNHAQNDLQEWFSKPLDGLEGRTPGEALDALVSIEETMLYFEEAATRCDDEIPDRLRQKLGVHGSAAVDALMALALAPEWEAPSETGDRPKALVFATQSIRLLAEWKTKEALELLAAKFSSVSDPDEGIADAFRAFCVAIGPAAARILAGHVETATRAEGDALEGPIDYMVIAIADIGRNHPDERLFQCLRAAFRRMEHKAVGAICLGDYGDGRAVPTLKGFLDRFEGRIDRQTFYEVTNAIRRLGGVLTDIRNPFAGDAFRPS